MTENVSLKTKRTLLTVLDESHAELMLNYYLENNAHLSPWEPERGSDFYTIEHFKRQLSKNNSMLKSESAINFAAMSRDRAEIIGVCSFSNIVQGVFQACNLGYSLAKKYEGKGYMTEILEVAIEYMFDAVGLHRIMANYRPENERSASTLRRLGFEQEGFAKSYLKINGRWHDHVLTSKINPDSGRQQS